MDTPAWWNMGHRPAKFVDGVFPMDSPRVDAVFYAPTHRDHAAGTGVDARERPRPERVGRGAEVAALPVPDRHRARRAGRGALPHARPVGARAQQPDPPARGQRLVRELPRRLRAALCARSRVPRHARARGHRRLHRAARHHRHRSGAPARQQRVGAGGGPRQLLRLPADRRTRPRTAGRRTAPRCAATASSATSRRRSTASGRPRPTSTTARCRTSGSC